MQHCSVSQATCSNHNDAINMWPRRDADQVDFNLGAAPVQSVCRLCMLKGGATMEDIFHNSGRTNQEDTSSGGGRDTMAGQISWVTQLKLYLGDGLPSHICQQCIFQLNLALTFKERCLNADQVLRQIYLEEVKADNCSTSSPTKDSSISPDASHSMFVKVEPLSPCNFQDHSDEVAFPDEPANQSQDEYLPADLAPDSDLPTDPSPDDIKIEIVEHNVGDSVCDEGRRKNVRGWTGTEGRLTCDTCRKTYKTWDQLRRHLRNHLARRISCPDCSAKFHRPAHLKRHMASVHLKERPHVCPVCDKSFGTLSTLSTHQRSHTGVKLFPCQMCDKSFAHQSTLTTHIRGAHFHERAYKCSYCPQSFAAKGTLSKHVRIHTNDKRYKCKLCPKAFTVGASLRMHHLTHTGARPHECPHCDKLFARVQGLTAHVRVHTGERPYECPVCQKTFVQQGALAIHLRIHDNIRDYTCAVCSSKFHTKKALARHIKTHTGEKDYECTLCEKRFARDTGLAVHMRVHSGERPYPCDSCGKSFRQQGSLIAHTRCHTGAKPYHCEECDAEFRQKGTLITHMRRHTGDKPYKCAECADTFAQTGNLNDHYLRHHSEKAMAKKLLKMLKELEQKDACDKDENAEVRRDVEETKTKRRMSRGESSLGKESGCKTRRKIKVEVEDAEVEVDDAIDQSGERDGGGNEEEGMEKIMNEIKERKERKSKAAVSGATVKSEAEKRVSLPEKSGVTNS